MKRYQVDIAPEKLVSWIIAEKASAGGHLDFFERTRVDYDIEEKFDRAAYDLEDAEKYDLVSLTATLDVEPPIEQNYWILRVTVANELGPRRITEEDAFISEGIAVDTFRDAFLGAAGAKVTVALLAQTDEAKEHFDDWLAKMRRKHA